MKISIILRSHNDIQYIDYTLRSLLSQDTSFDMEIISIDDHSSDGTKEVIAQYKQLIIVPPPAGTYTPPKTLNAAIKATSGEIIVFVNADAKPMNNSFLAELVKPFSELNVGATYAKQIPRPDAFVLVKLDYLRFFGKTAPRWRGAFSLAASAIRKDLLLQYPFDDKMQYSEDVELATRLLNAGFLIKYTPQAIAEHSHNYTPEQMRKRFYGEGVANAQIFKTKPCLLGVLVSFAKAILQDMLFILKNRAFSQLYPALRYRYIQRASLYCGERDQAKRELTK